MPPVRYRIVACPEGWRLFSDAERIGLFRDEAAARHAALDIANTSRLLGHDVEVLLESARGEIRALGEACEKALEPAA